jgi:pyruvate ferredoxin oxidoreductase alpha subunit
MRKQIEGSRAVAEAIALCRPQVICAYPITPQTHIVEALSEMTCLGDLSPCEFINVESEFAALSVAIGACAGGARAYTATSSQGLLFMTEAVYNASGLGLPIVMTIGNRAIGAPINIWNDHSDSMSMRDAGWIQLHAENNQEAVDLHIQAFRLAEALSCPVMVCMDGYVLTHAFEAVDIPTQEQVDRFLPAFEPRMVLDPDDPVTIGAMVGPEAFTEVRYLADRNLRQALEMVPSITAEFEAVFGRSGGGLLTTYRADDAEVITIALGSVSGTIQEVVDELRCEGVRVGSINIRCYRPFPYEALRRAIGNASAIVVLDRSISPGSEGPLVTDARLSLSGLSVETYSVIAGIGGRPITKTSLHGVLSRLGEGSLGPVTYLDLNEVVIRRESQATSNKELVL